MTISLPVIKNDLHQTTYKFFFVAGNGENDKIRTIELCTVMVSFWRPQKKSHPSELICLGILIRSNWILLTTKCAEKLEPSSDIVIKYGIYAIHNIFPEESKIVNITLLLSNSVFSIVYVSNFTKQFRLLIYFDFITW